MGPTWQSLDIWPCGMGDDKCTLSTTTSSSSARGKWPARSACQWERDKVARRGPRGSVRASMVCGAHRSTDVARSSDGSRHHSGNGPGPHVMGKLTRAGASSALVTVNSCSASTRAREAVVCVSVSASARFLFLPKLITFLLACSETVISPTLRNLTSMTRGPWRFVSPRVIVKDPRYLRDRDHGNPSWSMPIPWSTRHAHAFPN